MKAIRFPVPMPPVKSRRRSRSDIAGALLIVISLLAWAIVIYSSGSQ